MSKKFALLIGINYKNTGAQLNGCINDALNMRKNLIENFGYVSKNIVVMSEEGPSYLHPTGTNIKNQLLKLIDNTTKNKSNEIFFHYSGHGSSIWDRNSDEDDGRDEVIIPVDYIHRGVISDDLLHKYFQLFPVYTKVFCLFDCCHSGTVLDLKYRYTYNHNFAIENKDDNNINKNICMISGCRDDQTSADAMINNNWAGAMTAAFLHSINAIIQEKKQNEIKFTDLLVFMRQYLKNKYSQIPQLSCTNKQIVDNIVFEYC